MKKLIVSICIGIIFFSCSSDEDSQENVSVLYKQTFCADPWGFANDDSELVSKIKTYFEAASIQISNVKIDGKGTQQVCNACHCLSGKRIILNVHKTDLNAIKEYGFQENN